MRSAKRAALTAFLFLLTPILIPSSALPAAGAQETETRARLRLLAIPPAHASDDDIAVRVRVVNEGRNAIEGFRLTLGAGGLIRTRSDLENSFEGVPLLNSFTTDFLDRTIPPGEALAVDLNTPVTNLVGVPTEGGVHPLSLALFSVDDALTPLDTLTTQVMVYPADPLEPLNLVPVLPLNAEPTRGPDGAFSDDGSGASWIEGAVAEGGWLRGLAVAVERATRPIERPRGDGNQDGREEREPLELGFAPTPRVIEELAAMVDGFVREEDGGQVADDAPAAVAAEEVVALWSEIVGRDSVQPLLVPYGYPDLPTIDEHLGAGDIGVQLTEALTVLQDALDLDLDRAWVYPPAGRVDDPSLQALQSAGVDGGVFFTPEALESSGDPATSGCPIAALSFVCAIQVTTDVGPIPGFVSDAGLQERFADLKTREAGALEVQRVLAITAMIHAEQPGTSGRILYATAPPEWHPRPAVARALFTGFRDAPWLRSMTPQEALTIAEPVAERRVVPDLDPTPETPDEGYFADIEAAQDAVQSFSTFIGEREPRGVLQRLRRNILVAEGRTLWDGGGAATAAAYATDSYDEAVGEMRKVTLRVPSQTTFTSRTGTLDVSLFNQTGYPVEARVVLRALDMNFQPSVVEDTFPPGTNRLSIQAEAQTSGTFPIEVRLETPDGYAIGSEAVQVRSTEFNIVALSLTLGAVGFLIAFYMVKALRRRSRRQETVEATSD